MEQPLSPVGLFFRSHRSAAAVVEEVSILSQTSCKFPHSDINFAKNYISCCSD